ncbi:MAG: hypothetical protein GX799_00080 [Crenarchaeota archaeon]|nr:hypothetical protein [Thermoproteota archaeon]
MVQYFSSRDEAVKGISDLIFSGNINVGMIAEAVQDAEKRKQVQEQQKKEAAEKRRLREIELNKPSLKYHKLWNVRKCGASCQEELDEYLRTYEPLSELEDYLAVIKDGLFASDDFKNQSGLEATAYLQAGIKRRKASTQPSIEVQLKDATDKTDKLSKDVASLNIQSNHSHPESAKQYTA